MGALPRPFLLQDDASLLVDLLRQQKHAEGHVGEIQEALVNGLGLGVRQGQDVRRLIEAGEGVLVLAESQSDGFEVRQQLTGREIFRAVEGHVLQEVRHPFLPVLLVQRPRRYVQPEGNFSRRRRMRPHPVSHAVVQGSPLNCGVHRQRRLQVQFRRYPDRQQQAEQHRTGQQDSQLGTSNSHSLLSRLIVRLIGTCSLMLQPKP